MTSHAPHWLAGPLGYHQREVGDYSDRTIGFCGWDFIGCLPNGEIRRWRMTFSLETRKFTLNQTHVTDWERRHSKEIADLYRPIAVLRSDLPKGALSIAMRAMLSEKDIAEVMALSLTGGKHANNS